MNLSQYYIDRQRTECDYSHCTIECPALGPEAARLVHYGLGLATEAVELAVALRGTNVANQIEEMGDICWFAAGACDALGEFPTDAEIAQAPKTGIVTVLALCELFASRIKGALYYGSPAKPNDPTPDYWRRVPARILAQTIAIANAQTALGRGGILASNIAKLKARYPQKFDAIKALNRDPQKELAHLAAMGNVTLTSGDLPPPPAKPKIKFAAPTTQDRPNAIIAPHADAPGVEINEKELKELLSAPENTRPRTLSGLLRKQPTQGHENGIPPAELPAAGLPAAAAIAPEDTD